MADDWYAGNANTDSKDRRGWLIGHVIDDADDIRATDDVEIKWGVHRQVMNALNGPPTNAAPPW